MKRFFVLIIIPLLFLLKFGSTFIHVRLQMTNRNKNTNLVNKQQKPTSILAAGTVTGEVLAGFTLAEVLITLLIIGVVASLVIPGLINDTQNQEYKTQYKKAYGVATQALKKAYAEGLLQPRTAWCSAPESLDNWNAFKSQFNVVKECDSTNFFNNCWADGELIYQTGNPPGLPRDDVLAKFFVDNSGMEWVYFSCYWYLLDTNGLKGPNKYGKDRFEFTFTPTCNNIQFSIGTPLLIGVYNDYSGISLDHCPSGGCYYKSWLYQ